ncbi:putative signal transducing protein [Paenibacillus senegalensis]|uniref:putative signal transducing protein n=1 Tax=Paenibacillus senegalensis TaxID=1465766 RepID=UPI000288847D|nr:DUF2007 domain-containing protein [Paenibacillus senegalensis]
MAWVWILLAVAVVGLVIWRIQQSWTTLFVGTGPQAEAAQYKYNLLKDEGVRCKLKSMDTQGAAVGMAPGGEYPGTAQYRVMVHKNDVEKARAILARQDEASLV